MKLKLEDKKAVRLGIVVPCFNEEAVIAETIERLQIELRKMQRNRLIARNSFLLFVDDGSRDETFRIIGSAASKDRNIKCIKLSRNAGHQSALLSGLAHAFEICDCTISIDADLQDDISKMTDFVSAYREGFEIVYGVREDRPHDSAFKKMTASGYYKVQSFFGLPIIKQHADFRLLGHKALQALLQFREVNIYLRGMVPLLGFTSKIVYYSRSPRLAGETKYPLRKMLALALDGVTSFSARPLHLVMYMGMLVSLISFGMIIWIAFEKFIFQNTIQGWASLTISIFFLGGIQMVSLGIIGIYIGKIFFEVKDRPKYFIEQAINFPTGKENKL